VPRGGRREEVLGEEEERGRRRCAYGGGEREAEIRVGAERETRFIFWENKDSLQRDRTVAAWFGRGPWGAGVGASEGGRTWALGAGGRWGRSKQGASSDLHD